MKRLKDFKIEDRKLRSTLERQVLSMQFSDDEATKRVVMHSAKRVIRQHKKKFKNLHINELYYSSFCYCGS